MKGLPAPSEHQIQQAIIGFLRYKGYYVQRLNAGKFSMGEGQQRRYVNGVEPGTPDILAFRKASLLCRNHLEPLVGLLFIEVKRPGNKPTPLQLAKMAELEQYGARCITVHSVEDVEAAIA